MFCAKNRSKKHHIFEKWDKFENRPSCKRYSPCKSYRLCIMGSLGQTLKMPKTCEKPFYKNIKVVLRKNSSKKHQIFEKWDKFENKPSCKGHSLCKMVTLAQKLKMPNTCEKPFYKNIKVVLWKKPLEKTPNIGEIRQVWKSANFQRLQPIQRL